MSIDPQTKVSNFAVFTTFLSFLGLSGILEGFERMLMPLRGLSCEIEGETS